MEFDNNNVDNSEYLATSTLNNVVRSQVKYFILNKNTRSFGRNFDEFHSFASELSRAADVIGLSEMWFSANTFRDVQRYAGFHTYRADKSRGASLCLSEIVHIDTCGQFFSVSCIL